MASFGMGFVHAMLIDLADGNGRGSTWDRERRLADSLVETTSRFDGKYEPPASETEPPPPEPRFEGRVPCSATSPPVSVAPCRRADAAAPKGSP